MESRWPFQSGCGSRRFSYGLNRRAESQPSDPNLRDELSILLSQGIEDHDLATSLKVELAEFFAKTPPDLGADDEFLASVRQGDIGALLQEAASAVGARLTGDAG